MRLDALHRKWREAAEAGGTRPNARRETPAFLGTAGEEGGLSRHRPPVAASRLVSMATDYLPVVPRDLKEARESFYGSEVVGYLSADLGALLREPDAKFWSVCKRSQSLHVALDSYLRYARRPHDRDDTTTVSGSTNVTDCTESAEEEELSRRVFMCYYRMAMPLLDLEGGVEEQKRRGDLLYQHSMVDVPKVLDLCAIYGEANPRLVGDLLRNVLELQPRFRADAIDCLRAASINVDRVVEQLLSSEEDFVDLLEHLSYLADALATLCSFLAVYPDAPSLLMEPSTGGGKNGGAENGQKPTELLRFLLRSRACALPKVALALDIAGTEVHGRFRRVYRGADSVVADCLTRCLDPGAGAAEGPRDAGDLLGVLRAAAEAEAAAGTNDGGILAALERDHSLSERVLRAVEAGKASVSKGQATELDAIMGSVAGRPGYFVGCLYPDGGGEGGGNGDAGGKPLADALLEKQVDAVRAILPDYGRGFIAACLRHYGGNAEVCVSHMMEGSLPYELATLDSNLEEVAPAAATAEALTPKNDGDGDGLGYYKRRGRGGGDSDDGLDFGDADLVVKDRILGMYEDDYDDSWGFEKDAVQREDLEDLSTGSGAQGGGQRPSQGKGEKQREFFVYEGKVFNYPKPGATKVTASSAPQALVAARVAEAEADRAASKKAREERLVKGPGEFPKQQQGKRGPGSYRRKEKNKAKVGNHNRKQKALRKQGL